MTNEGQQPRERPTESDLEELAKHFFNHATKGIKDECGDFLDSDYKVSNIDSFLQHWTHTRYENNGVILTLGRDYETDTELKGWNDLDVIENDEIFEATLKEKGIKEVLKRDISNYLPEPKLSNLDFYIEANWREIIYVNPTRDGIERRSILDRTNLNDSEEAILPLIKTRYEGKIREVMSEKDYRIAMGKAIDLGFDMSRDAKLGEDLDKIDLGEK